MLLIFFSVAIVSILLLVVESVVCVNDCLRRGVNSYFELCRRKLTANLSDLLLFFRLQKCPINRVSATLVELPSFIHCAVFSLRRHLSLVCFFATSHKTSFEHVHKQKLHKHDRHIAVPAQEARVVGAYAVDVVVVGDVLRLLRYFADRRHAPQAQAGHHHN